MFGAHHGNRRSRSTYTHTLGHAADRGEVVARESLEFRRELVEDAIEYDFSDVVNVVDDALDVIEDGTEDRTEDGDLVDCDREETESGI